MASCSANFSETTAQVGDTIHCNFTWSGGTAPDFATMVIIKPNGYWCTGSFYLAGSSSGSHTSICLTDMPGIYTALITVFASVNAECEDTINVSTAGGATLEAITCAHQPSCEWAQPPVKTNFAYNEEVYVHAMVYWPGHNFTGQEYRWKWYHKGQLVWENYVILEGYTGRAGRCLWWTIGPTHGPGTGHIEFYLNGEYLGTTNDYTITCPSCSTLPNQTWCEYCGCYWYGNSCHSTGAGHITTSPSTTLNFPNTLVGNCSAEQTIRVTSDGAGAAPTIISLELSDANQYQCTNLTLPYSWAGNPGTYLDVKIRFCPTSYGEKWNATARFACNSCPLTLQTGLRGKGTLTCPDYTNETDCTTDGCYWYNDSCHSMPQGTIGDIDINGSIFYNSFTAGQQNALIAQIRLMNTGDTYGLVYTKYFYLSPSQQWVTLTNRFEVDLFPDESAWGFHRGNIPNISGNILFGVKVWGEDETEPSW